MLLHNYITNWNWRLGTDQQSALGNERSVSALCSSNCVFNMFDFFSKGILHRAVNLSLHKRL